MKAILVMAFSLILFSSNAGEVTGVGQQALRVLERNQLSIDELKQQGFKVLLGEVTGVGKAISLDRIEMVISQKDLLKMKDLSHIEFLHPSQAKALKDVSHLEFNAKKITPNQIKGIIYE